MRNNKIDFDINPRAFERYNPMLAQSNGSDFLIEGYIGDEREGAANLKTVSSILAKGAGRNVTFDINSGGGSFFDGLSIYNKMREHGNVTVNIIGMAASAASIIAMGAKTINIADTAFLMIHNTWSMVVGNANDLEEAADTARKFDKSMVELYAARTGMDVDAIKEYMDKETFFSAKEALEQGFVDNIINSVNYKDDDEEASDYLMAKNLVDLALARHNMPRSKRREIIAALNKSCAVESPTPRADDAVVAKIQELKSTIRGIESCLQKHSI